MACEHCTNSSYLMREAIRGHQRSSKVIRGHQRSSLLVQVKREQRSEVIRGHHSSYKPNVSSGGQSSR